MFEIPGSDIGKALYLNYSLCSSLHVVLCYSFCTCDRRCGSGEKPTTVYPCNRSNDFCPFVAGVQHRYQSFCFRLQLVKFPHKPRTRSWARLKPVAVNMMTAMCSCFSSLYDAVIISANLVNWHCGSIHLYTLWTFYNLLLSLSCIMPLLHLFTGNAFNKVKPPSVLDSSLFRLRIVLSCLVALMVRRSASSEKMLRKFGREKTLHVPP